MRGGRNHTDWYQISRLSAVPREHYCLELAILTSQPPLLAFGWAFNKDFDYLANRLAVNLSRDPLLQSDDLL